MTELEQMIRAVSKDSLKEFCVTKSGDFKPSDHCQLTDETEGLFSAQYHEKFASIDIVGFFVNIEIFVFFIKLQPGITLSERSCRRMQFDFAKHLVRKANDTHYGIFTDWIKETIPPSEIRNALFVFSDDTGCFRFSLVEVVDNPKEEIPKRFRRYTFFVDPAQSNRTFKERMEMPWGSFEALKEAFSVERLNKEFYNELFKWYERAVNAPEVIFPCETVSAKEGEKENDFRTRIKSEQVIRLITRLLFVWFIKQKKLVPEEFFSTEGENSLTSILKNFIPLQGDNYYRAILQNLFFATLNSEINCRDFAIDGSDTENSKHFDIKTLYRYGAEFAFPKEKVLALFRSIPFLNGGLFECLDCGKKYFDGFSRNPNKVAHVPNEFFFSEDENKLGLIPLLRRYNFTIDENAPNDEDVALDPELLGKVFENLLAAFVPDTSLTARKATGSFYTPREIVNYMVDESLIAHLMTKMEENAGPNDKVQTDEMEKVLRLLFTEGARPTNELLCQRLDEAICTVKILDPACGSGAFPMGMLLRTVELLRILRNLPAGESLYGLKLQLIENCIYGIDIQCIAVQVSKLRFFISLVCEQTPTNDADNNFGINPLPNLETKFVAADSLVGLPTMAQDVLDLSSGNIAQLKEELWDIRHRHFQPKTYRDKKALRQQDLDKRNKIEESIKVATKPNLQELNKLKKQREKFEAPDWRVCENGGGEQIYLFADIANEVKEKSSTYDANLPARKEIDAKIAIEEKKQNTPSTIVDEIAHKLSGWDPYDQNVSSSYFDSEWMFNVKDGFDIVIGNPPYVDSETMSASAPSMRSKLKNHYISAKGNWDLFVIFIERSTQLVKTGGHVALIVPNKLISANYTESLRKFLSKLAITEIRDYSHIPVFHETDVYPVTIIMQKEIPTKKSVSIIVMNDIESISTHSLIPYCDFTADIDWSKYFQSKDVVSLLLKLRMKPKLSEHEVKIFGAATVSEAYEIKKVVVDSQSVQGKRLINTGTIDPYCVFWGKRPTQYIKNQYMFPVVTDDALRLISKTRAEQSSSTKLIIAGMSKRIEAVLDSGCYLAGKSTTIVLGEYTILVPLLGILNSSLITFYLNAFYHSLKMAGGYINIGTQVINSLPIPKLNNSQKASINRAVENILSAKKIDPSADTSALESEIDQLVYQLYGLTDEEIAIVEASSKSKEVQLSVTSSKAAVAASASAEDDDDGSDARN
jgi:hypothetical protein